MPPVSRAEEMLDRVSRENHALLIGDEVTAEYLVYLKDGGSTQELYEAIKRASNEMTAGIALCDVVDALLGK